MLKQLLENSCAGIQGLAPVTSGRVHPERIQIEKRTIASKNNETQQVT
jgi:hypothetical protein